MRRLRLCDRFREAEGAQALLNVFALNLRRETLVTITFADVAFLLAQFRPYRRFRLRPAAG